MNKPFDGTYSDETSTGSRCDAFRGIGRASIAARTEDPSGFEWVRALKRDHFPDKVELKAPLVLAVMGTNNLVRKQVLDNVSSATIVIVDISEHYRRLLTRICEMTGNPPPTRGEALSHALERATSREFARAYVVRLREGTIESTAVPKIETMLRDLLQEAGSGAVDRQLFVNREDLRTMSGQEFEQFVARLSDTFADALAPERQEAAISAAQRTKRILTPGYLGFVTLGQTISVDRHFDRGFQSSFKELTRVHDRVLRSLEGVKESFFVSTLHGGTLQQHDSAQLLGIQAADIAARIAADEYERFPDDRSAGVAAVKKRFGRVFLNDGWV
ncbi:MAG: hypothetical protein AB1714_10050 [Acidobacteriota bacterium]